LDFSADLKMKFGLVRTTTAYSGIRWVDPLINTLTPNDHYRGRTALLISKVAFYIFIQQI